MGGKTRIAKQIAAVIDQYREPGQLVWDAFCGGLSSAVALSNKGPVLASDGNAALIYCYRAVLEGWDPPTAVSREQYNIARNAPDSDPMKAFCGFGCSFAGKWFAGYAEPHPIIRKTGEGAGFANFARQSSNLLKKKLKIVTNVSCLDFLFVVPGTIKAILYLDPPYGGTTSYAGGPPFDRDLFVSRVKEWSEFTDVFVSEYDFPVGKVVWQKDIDSRVNVKSGAAKKSTEKLFHIPKGSLLTQ